MITKGVSYGGFLAVAVLGVAYLYSDTDGTINRFGEAVSEKLCDFLPPVRRDVTTDETTTTTQTTETTTATPKVVPSKESIYNPKVTNGAIYNAKKAMDERYRQMKEMCHKYSDVLRPESIIGLQIPQTENFIYDDSSNTVFCPLESIAAKSFHTLFQRVTRSSQSDPHRLENFKHSFPKSMKDKKRGIIVRHPMERLVSVYRKLYAPSYNPITDQEEGSDISFNDFIQLVVEGPIELSKFLEENQVEGESLGIDTGMVDGEGQSKHWKPYWKHCGICHPLFQPHFILHMDHVEEDKKVLVEMMNNTEDGKEWASVKFPSVASQPELIEHLYSQLTKSEIKAIYEKYRPDHEIFGFTPDFFLQFGKDE